MWRLYALLVPFVFIYNMVRAMRCPYLYAVNEAQRKMLKSFKYNLKNETECLGAMGAAFYCRYALGIAKEGIDYI